MTLNEIKAKLNSNEYEFLRNNALLGDKVTILALGGSHAYGTSNENSDIDIRGVMVPTARDIILNTCIEQFDDKETDTVIYNLDKMLKLLSECNPNTIEILGNKKEHYLYVSKYGKMILDNKDIFLSQMAIPRFAGYANQQLYRLKQKSLCAMSEVEYNNHIAKVITGMKTHLTRAFGFDVSDSIDAYEKDGQLMFKVNFEDIDDSKFIGLVDEVKTTINNYKTKSNRNKKAVVHEKLNKHAMHLVRLYMMGIDLLEKKEIITYRDGADHELLMDIRNKKYFDSNNMPTEEFFDIVRDYEKRFEYAKKHTDLPMKPDYKAIEELKYTIYSDIITNNNNNK